MGLGMGGVELAVLPGPAAEAATLPLAYSAGFDAIEGRTIVALFLDDAVLPLEKRSIASSISPRSRLGILSPWLLAGGCVLPYAGSW